MILDSFRLDGKVALVTGSSRGLGQGAAVALAEAGADVALLDRGDASETAERIRALGRRVHPMRCDFVERDRRRTRLGGRRGDRRTRRARHPRQQRRHDPPRALLPSTRRRTGTRC